MSKSADRTKEVTLLDEALSKTVSSIVRGSPDPIPSHELIAELKPQLDKLAPAIERAFASVRDPETYDTINEIVGRWSSFLSYHGVVPNLVKARVPIDRSIGSVQAQSVDEELSEPLRSEVGAQPSPVVARATGRRKAATARVLLRVGSGKFVVNGRRLEEYFPRDALRASVLDPIREVEAEGLYDVFANVSGGGISGQAGAIRHGVSKSLVAITETHRVPLKRRGFLTRDARKKERKKPGKKGARARYQYSKR